MPKKGYKQTEEHTKKVANAKKGKPAWNNLNLNEDEIKKLYLEEEKSCVAIAKIVNCNQSTIQRFLERNNIQRRNPSFYMDEKWKSNMSRKRRELVREGKLKIWNTGLTKETDERVRDYGKKLKGRIFTEEHNKKVRETKKRLFAQGKLIPWNKDKHQIATMGENNPAKRPEVREKIRLSKLGKPRSDETKEKLRLAKLGKPNPKCSETKKRLFAEGKLVSYMKGKPKSEETKRRLSETWKDKYKKGYTNPSMGTKRPDLSLRNKDPEYQKKCVLGNVKSPTKPEQIMINLIQENNLPFNFVGNGAIWFRGDNNIFNPDFLSKNPKHIIEIFGDYWHNLPKNVEKDKLRLETYAKFGYKTLIIWEHELKNPQEIVNKINEFIR